MWKSQVWLHLPIHFFLEIFKYQLNKINISLHNHQFWGGWFRCLEFLIIGTILRQQSFQDEVAIIPDMPEVFIIGPRTLQLYRKYQKYFPSRRAAFRAAKRDANIPMSRHPDMVVYPQTDAGDTYGLDDRNVRLFIFNLGIGGIAFEFHIREDREDQKHGQTKHFNTGIHTKKLKGHYYWEDDTDWTNR